MGEKNEMNEFMLKDAMKDCKLESARKDAIWEQIRAKRSAYSAKGSRRHLEKIIVGYLGAALAFTLTITVGAGLWAKMSDGEPTNPAGHGGDVANAAYDMLTEKDEVIKKTLRGDKEGVDEFAAMPAVKEYLHHTYASSGFYPRPGSTDITDPSNIFRIHNNVLDEQDTFSVYMSIERNPYIFNPWVYVVVYDRVFPLYRSSDDGTTTLRGAAKDIWDIVIADLNGDGSSELIITTLNEVEIEENTDQKRLSGKQILCLWVVDQNGIRECVKTPATVPLAFGNVSDTAVEICEGQVVKPLDRDEAIETGLFEIAIGNLEKCGNLIYDGDAYSFVEQPPADRPLLTDPSMTTEPPATTEPPVTTNPVETTELPEQSTTPETPELEVITEQGIVLWLNDSGNGYFVRSIGDCTDSDIVIPASCNGLPVTEIGACAFMGVDWMTSITIPDSITNIAIQAFHKCKNLTSITLPEGLLTIGMYAFAETGLTDITIPEKVTWVDNHAFFGCKKLTSASFLCRKVKFERNLFLECENLTDVYFIGDEAEWKKLCGSTGNEILTSAKNIRYGNVAPEVGSTVPEEPKEVETEEGLLLKLSDSGDYYSVAGIGSFAGSELVIPTSYGGLPITMIAPYAFDGCEGLISVTIPEGILEIGSGAFQRIESLISVTIPSTVRTVGSNAFLGCVNLQSVTIAEGVLRYGAEVFKDCRSLKTITIPKGAEYIGEWIFDGCDSLTDVYFGGSKEEWEYAAFDVLPPAHATLHFAR